MRNCLIACVHFGGPKPRLWWRSTNSVSIDLGADEFERGLTFVKTEKDGLKLNLSRA